MAFKKRRLIQAISDRAPSDDKSLLAAVQREVWPFLKQIRRLLNDNGEGNGPGGGGTGSPFDDHLVIEHDLDAVPGTLEGKTTNRANMVRNRVTEGGIDKLELGVVISTATPLGPTPGGSPGSTGPDVKPPAWDHQHPLQDMPNPAVTGSTLWTGALKPIPEATCILNHGEAYDIPGNWVPAGPAFTWQFRIPATISGMDSAGGDSFPIHNGDTIAMWIDGIAGEAPYFGLYKVLDNGDRIGGPPGNAIIQRVGYANTPATLTGLRFRITGVGALHGGDYFTQTATITAVDTTPTAWTVSSTGPTANLDVLFSMALSQRLDLDPTTLFAVQTQTSPDGLPTLISMGPICEVAVADLGVDRIPAGLQTVTVRNARVSAGYNPTTNPGDTWLAVMIRKRTADGSTVTVIVGSGAGFRSLPLTDVGGPVAPFSYVLPAAATFSPGDVLQFIPCLVTTCLHPVEVTLEWNNQARDAIAWATTMQFPAAGTSDHLELQHVKQDVAAGDKPDHPWCAIGPDGRAHVKLGEATLTGSGTTRKLVIPADCSVAKLVVGTSEVIYGIDRTGFAVPDVETSDEIRILVVATSNFHVTFVHNDEDMGGDATYLGDVGMNVSMKSTTFLRFARDPTTGSNGIWRRL